MVRRAALLAAGALVAGVGLIVVINIDMGPRTETDRSGPGKPYW